MIKYINEHILHKPSASMTFSYKIFVKCVGYLIVAAMSPTTVMRSLTIDGLFCCHVGILWPLRWWRGRLAWNWWGRVGITIFTLIGSGCLDSSLSLLLSSFSDLSSNSKNNEVMYEPVALSFPHIILRPSQFSIGLSMKSCTTKCTYITKDISQCDMHNTPLHVD